MSVTTDKINILFLQGQEALEILHNCDNYFSQMKDVERGIRMGIDKPVTEEEYRNYVDINKIVDWSEKEKEIILSLIEKITTRINNNKYKIKFPEHINLIKTTGEEDIRESGGHCRKNTIVIPLRSVNSMQYSTYNIYDLLIHELFHIQSQNDYDRRIRLYASIGFSSCNEIELPTEFDSLRLTNPDCPNLDVRISIMYNNEKKDVVPVLLYDKKRGYGFFSRLYIELLEIENTNDNWQVKKENDKYNIIPIEETDFFEQVGDIDYYFHPEEILATRFSNLILHTNRSNKFYQSMHEEFITE